MRVEQELGIIGLETDSKEHALQLLGSLLIKQGYVKEGFVESILNREKTYPTGLPTEPFGVAIPHTDGDMVHRSAVAFASLKDPVKFLMMGTDGKLVDVKLIFMLALKSPEDQLEILQKLMGLIQNPEMVSQMVHIKSVEALNDLVEGTI